MSAYIFELKVHWFFAVITIAGGILAQLYVPLFIGSVQDLITEGLYSEVGTYCIWFTVLILISALCTFIKVQLLTKISSNLSFKIRNRLFDTIMFKDMEFFDEWKTGDLLSRLVGDTEIIQMGFSMNITNFTNNLLLAVCSLGLLIWISWKLCLALVITMIPLNVAGLFITSRLKFVSENIQNHKASFSVVAEESFGNAKTVKSFANEQYEAARFFKYNSLVNDWNIKRGWYAGFMFAIFSGLIYLVLIVIIYMGSYLYQQGEVTLGNLTSFLLYLIYLITEIISLLSSVEQFVYVLGACGTIAIIIEHKHKLNTDGTYIPASGKLNGDIVLKNIKFHYPTKPDVTVLKDITIDIKQNKVVAIVGHSGSGKSSIVSLIERFYDPNEGSVYIDGVDIKDYNNKWFHNQVSLVQQEPVLFTGTIQDNIIYGYEQATKEEVENACKMANIYNSIMLDEDIFPQKLQTEVGERGTQLSGGQKQRIAIARALVRNPRVILLDEATSALDAESEYQVQQALDELIKKGDRTIIVVAHRLSTIRDADEIIVMDKGVVMEKGTHKELIDADGVYKKLVSRQLMEL